MTVVWYDEILRTWKRSWFQVDNQGSLDPISAARHASETGAYCWYGVVRDEELSSEDILDRGQHPDVIFIDGNMYRKESDE